MSHFAEYIKHGWVLVPIAAGQKGPRGLAARGWNERANCISDPAFEFKNAGLAHAYSGTCAIDVDDYVFAQAWLAERGVNLDALFMAPDAVQITSRRDNHAKLIFSLPEPLASKQIKNDEPKPRGALDFRCATSAGMTVQDVLPPSIHPDTGLPYEWIYNELVTDWRTPPPLPEALKEIWIAELGTAATATEIPEKGAALDELRALIYARSPDMSRDEWIRIGMIIHHETDGGHEGLMLWDEWSQGSSKYRSFQDLQTCWNSFHDTPNAVTIGALRQEEIAQPSDFTDLTVAAPTDEVDPWEAQKQINLNRFTLTQVGEFTKRPPQKWIVDGLLPHAEFAMIFGPSGAGKSFVALDLAFAVAYGYTWFNRATLQGTAIWIAAEAAGAMRDRVAAYSHARGVNLDETDLWVVEQNISLAEIDDTDALLHVIREKEPLIIIIDTLSAASGGANENSGEDMNMVLKNCRKLHEETGALIVLIHHSGKDQSRGARGWSGLKAAMDTELGVSQLEDSMLRIMESTKQRYTREGVRFPFKLQTVPLDLEGLESCVVDPLDEAVLKGDGSVKLPGTAGLVFRAVFDLQGHTKDGLGPVRVQDVYDKVVVQLPRPPEGKRDTRLSVIQNVMGKLHAEGRVALADDWVSIGSLIND